MQRSLSWKYDNRCWLGSPGVVRWFLPTFLGKVLRAVSDPSIVWRGRHMADFRGTTRTVRGPHHLIVAE